MLETFVQQFLNYVWSNPSILFINSVTFGFMGLLLCVVYRDFLNRDRSRKNWPSVMGQVLSATAPRVVISRRGEHGREYRTKYIPHVKYSYAVDGMDYHGELDVSYDGWYFRSRAKRLLEHYPAGKEVTVYYDPQNPKSSALVRSSLRNVVGLITGVLISLLSVAIGCVWLLSIWTKYFGS